jgi:hypothetical protein
MRKAVFGRSLLAASLLCGAALLQACNQGAGAPPPPLAALPPTTQPAPSLIPGPLADQLPAAPPPRLLQVSNPDDAYAFADRAYAMDAAFADSPPDYDFEDDGATPWVWVANDGSQCVAEYTPAGWRYYYYDPGDTEPFFIADPEYGYGFEGGALVVVYDHYGRAVPPNADARRDEVAGQYLARAALLRTAAARDPHRAVAASDWTSQRTVISGQQRTWSQAQTSNPAWQAFHAQHAAADTAHWSAERTRREAWAARVDASLGDRGRAQAEWRAAGQNASLAAASSGRRAPAWAGWRGPPPGIGASPNPAPQGLARNADRSPGFAGFAPGGAHHAPPQLAEMRAPPGVTPRGASGPERRGHTFPDQPSPHVFAQQSTPAHAPRFAEAPHGAGGRAPSAESAGVPASAHIPEMARTPHGPAPARFQAQHFQAQHVQTQHAQPPHFQAQHFQAQHVQASHFQAQHAAAPHFQAQHVQAPHPAPAPHAHTAPPSHPDNRHSH